MKAAPYEKISSITTVGANEVLAMDFPGRAYLTKVIAVQAGGGAFNLDVYSRAFTTPAVAPVSINNDGNGKCLICTTDDHNLRVGDVVTLASTGVGGYNTNHTITSIPDSKSFVTGVNFSSTVYATGTWALNIPSTDWPNYKVIAQKAASGGKVEHFETAGIPFFNQDAQASTGYKRKIYIMLSASGTYKVTVAGVPFC